MKTYSLKSCEDFINKYINEHNGEALQIDEGVLGLGVMLLHGAPQPNRSTQLKICTSAPIATSPC